MGIEKEVEDVFVSAAHNCDRTRLLAVGVDKDHVHFIVQAKPTVSPTSIISRMKQLTTRMLWQKYDFVLENFTGAVEGEVVDERVFL